MKLNEMDKKANFHMIPEEGKIGQQKGETGNTYIVLSNKYVVR